MGRKKKGNKRPSEKFENSLWSTKIMSGVAFAKIHLLLVLSAACYKFNAVSLSFALIALYTIYGLVARASYIGLKQVIGDVLLRRDSPRKDNDVIKAGNYVLNISTEYCPSDVSTALDECPREPLNSEEESSVGMDNTPNWVEEAEDEWEVVKKKYVKTASWSTLPRTDSWPGSPLSSHPSPAQRHLKSSVTLPSPCAFLAKGKCVKGNACWYSHDSAPTVETHNRPVEYVPSSKLCRNFARHGTCIFGESCRFVHREYSVKTELESSPSFPESELPQEPVSEVVRLSPVVSFLKRVKHEEVCFLEKWGIPVVDGIEVLAAVSEECRQNMYSNFRGGDIHALQMFLSCDEQVGFGSLDAVADESGWESFGKDGGWSDLYKMHSMA